MPLYITSDNVILYINPHVNIFIVYFSVIFNGEYYLNFEIEQLSELLKDNELNMNEEQVIINEIGNY